MNKIIKTIIYWTIMAALITITSPIIILAAIVQPFHDTGVTTLFRSIINGYFEVLNGNPNPPTPADPKKPIRTQRKKFYDTMSHANRKHWEREVRESGYNPEQDPVAPHLTMPFQPSFILPHDEELYKLYYDKWWYLADSISRKALWTKSYWETNGRKIIDGIFIGAYILPESKYQINNAEEHKWVLETMMIPFYELEYNLEMLNAAHRSDNKLSDLKEFQVRYKILNNICMSKSSIAEKTAEIYRDGCKKVDEIRGSYDLFSDLWSMYWTWQDATLYYNQRKFFEREAKK